MQKNKRRKQLYFNNNMRVCRTMHTNWQQSRKRVPSDHKLTDKYLTSIKLQTKNQQLSHPQEVWYPKNNFS